MIRSRSDASIDVMIAAAREQTEEVVGLVTPLSADVFGARPAPAKWSVGEHLAHLSIATRPYLAVIDAAVADSRRRGVMGDAPYKGTLVGRLFIATLEPPPRLSVKTLGRLTPPRAIEPRAALADFRAAQGELEQSLAAARGVDLGRTFMRSPYLPLMRVAIVDAYRIVLAHTRRHVWHMHRALEAVGPPIEREAGRQ